MGKWKDCPTAETSTKPCPLCGARSGEACTVVNHPHIRRALIHEQRQDQERLPPMHSKERPELRGSRGPYGPRRPRDKVT